MKNKKLFILLLSSLALTSCNQLAPQGPQGERGEQGIQGEQGPQGEQGEKGDKGPVGIQGIQGEVGEQGKTGPQGEQGETGIKGDKGDTGKQGEQGNAGNKGETGDKGEQGDPGAMPELTVNEDGYWEINGEATTHSAKGEQGEQGKQGEQGDQGEQGPKGTTYNTVYAPRFLYSQGGYVECEKANYAVGEEINFEIYAYDDYEIKGIEINGTRTLFEGTNKYKTQMAEGGLSVKGVYKKKNGIISDILYPGTSLFSPIYQLHFNITGESKTYKDYITIGNQYDYGKARFSLDWSYCNTPIKLQKIYYTYSILHEDRMYGGAEAHSLAAKYLGNMSGLVLNKQYVGSCDMSNYTKNNEKVDFFIEADSKTVIKISKIQFDILDENYY